MVDLNTVILAAEKGGEEVQRYFGKILEVEEKKTVNDFRTKADLESEKAILKILTAKFPQFNFLSEEQGFIDNSSEFTFVIDPLDGSNNFVLGIPNFSVSIALMKGDASILGVIHQPVLKHTYYAQGNKGAFLDNKRIFVNKENNIEKASVSYACGYINSTEYEEILTHKLHKLGIKRYLTNWSPAFEFCLIASGKIEAIINNATELYDYAAGKVIVREAGGLISDFNGKLEDNDRGNIFLATNQTDIHQQLINVI